MSKNNKKIKIISNEKNNLNESQPLENVKSKYVLANTIKANKISAKLSKSVNNVVSDKNFVGFNEDDYQHVEKMCELNNVNLFVKNKSQFFDNISCEKNLHIRGQHVIGYTESEYANLNNDTALHIKGDTEINGNLFVYQNINSDKQINVEQSINIGFEKELPDNTSRLNVNGNSEFVGDNIIYGSEYIKNNLIVNDKANFYNDIFMSNSICLKKENINNITIIDNIISGDNYKILLNNILTSVKNNNQSESSVLKFYSKKNSNIYSGLISASKKFIISNNNFSASNTDNESGKKILAFILVYGIYSNSKIISVKPVLDTFVLIDSNENIITIGNTNTPPENKPIQYPISDKDSEKNNLQTNQSTINAIVKDNKLSENTSIFSSSIDLLKNNKFINFTKTNNDSSDDSSESSFILNKSDVSDNSENNNLNDFLSVVNNNNNICKDKKNSEHSTNSEHFEKPEKTKNLVKIEDVYNKADSINVFEINTNTKEENILNKSQQSKSIEEIKELEQTKNSKQSTKYEKTKKVSFNFDSDLDLEVFEIIKL
jgi:hypothetical protein